MPDDDRPTLTVPRARSRINMAWLPFTLFGFVRQWIEYGVASAVLLADRDGAVRPRTSSMGAEGHG